MKGIYYTWDKFRKEDPRQTVVIATYKGKAKEHTRIFFRGWMSREEAWAWCQANNIKRSVTYAQDQSVIETSVRLLRMGKIQRELEATRPKTVSAIKPL